jgi:L-ascorbate metabolism protein UlaG (beta-lactamase superfamily)
MKTTSLALFLLITALLPLKLSALDGDQAVNIHYLGHCAFILQFDDTLSVITDYAESYPYYSQAYISPIYKIYDGFTPDIATISHEHTDHYSASRIPAGVNYILQETDTLSIKDLLIKPVRTSEANTGTLDNSTYFFRYKGLTICHSGDLYANMKAIENAGQQAHLRELFPDTVDVLLLVIQSTENVISYAEKFIDFLKPRIVIPMHYWTPAYKSEFLSYLENENTLHGKTYEIINSAGASYAIYLNDTNQSPTRIVSLDPLPFGDPNPPVGDLAYGSTAYSTSILDLNHSSQKAIDGFRDTRWQSTWGATSAQLGINMGEEKSVNGVVLNWLYKVKSYEIELSTDSTDWNTVYSTTDHGNTLIDSVVFEQADAKYLRIVMTETGSAYGYGLYALGIYENLVVQTPNSIESNGLTDRVLGYPSPANEVINFDISVLSTARITIKLTDMSGNECILMDKIAETGSYTLRCNISALPEGLYYYTYTSGNLYKSERIIILRN